MRRYICLLLSLVLLTALCAGCVKPPLGTTSTAVPHPTTTMTDPTTTVSVPTQPSVDYANATVILYTANVRGNAWVYAAMAAAREQYEALGATVYLVDAGNHLQGSAIANMDMGLTVYSLMEAAGYAVAGMGVYDLVHGEAELGYAAHGDLTKFYTQAQLYRGTERHTYQQNAPWAKEPILVTRPAKDAARFQVICSNLTAGEDASGYYAFESSAVLGEQLKIGFVSSLPENAATYLQNDFLQGYYFGEISAPVCDILVSLGGGEGDIVIDAPTDGSFRAGACIVDNATLRVTFETVDLSRSHNKIAELLAALEIPEVIGQTTVMFDGSREANCNGQTNLGTLAARALQWYAQTQMEGLEYPVISIQSGSNCTGYLYSGEITEADLRNAYHAGTRGVGVIYVTGAQLLEMLEAATQQADCPGWAQVAGVEYTVDTTATYDWGEAYGSYYKASSIRRVTITSENFDPAATYAVIADRLLLEGSDTYYLFKDCPIVARGEQGLDLCDIVALYIRHALNGNLEGV